MFVTNHPQFNNMQNRMARLPRWGRIAVLLGVILPIVALGLSVLVIAVGSGILVLAAVVLILMAVRFGRRLFAKPADDGRRNVRIVVHSARVVDP